MTVEKPQETSNDDLINEATNYEIMSGCELKIDKDGKFFSFNQLAKENPVRERSNSSPKIERLQIKSEVRTLEQSTNLSIFSNNVSKKGARSRSRAERREIKSAAPKESLFEKT